MDKHEVVNAIVSASPHLRGDVLTSAIDLALEIAHNVHEGRRVGTIITVGRAEEVLRRSRPLILDPLAAHHADVRSIDRPELRGTIKQLAQLDGAFVLTENGRVECACRYLDVSADGVTLPFGFGSRHLAAAAISAEPGVVAIVVSESALVRLFHRGAIVAELQPCSCQRRMVRSERSALNLQS